MPGLTANHSLSLERTEADEPSAQKILALSAASDYDFRATAFEGDSLRDRFPEWVAYYRMKWAIARALRPKSILEIGVRYGYSAAAFLDASPEAEYLGIDLDSDRFGGAQGAINWAIKITAPYRAKFLVADSQMMVKFPGDIYDLIHVDGQQDGDGSFHDLRLAIQQARFILVDGYFWTAENFRAISEFLIRFRDLIEYYIVIPGYAGELLIKTRTSPNAALAPAHAEKSEDLRETYTGQYYLQDCGGFAEYRQTGGKELRDPRLATVAALATLREPGRVLDVGCGRGELAYHFAREGWQVTAVDYSADAVSLTEETFRGEPELRSRVELLQANIVELNLSGSYDLVVASDVVEHLTPSELDSMYARIAAHLAPGGTFLVHTYPNLWFFRYEHARRRRVAASVGAYLSGEPRTRYELLMHINEQNPRVLKRQLAKYFSHVLLWFGDSGAEAGSLLRRYSHRELAAAQDLWAVASSSPIDAAAVRSRLASDPLPATEVQGISLTLVDPAAEMQPGREYNVDLRIANQSVHALSSMQPFPVHISYHWTPTAGEGEAIFDGVRTPIRPPLAPATARSFSCKVVAPSQPGTYCLRMTLVQELVQWFDAAPIHVFAECQVAVVPSRSVTS